MDHLAFALLLKLTLLLAVTLLVAWGLMAVNPRWRILFCEVGAIGCLLLVPSAASPWRLPIPTFWGQPSLAPVFPVALEGASASTAMPGATAFDGNALSARATAVPANAAGHSWQPWVLGIIYAGGIVLLLTRQLLAAGRLRQALRSLSSVDANSLDGFTTLCREMGLERRPSILISDEALSPLATRDRQGPTVVLPAKLLQPGQEEALELALRHELHHLRHRDLLRARLMLVGAVLLWFHPLAWLLRRNHSAAIEELGDRVAAEDAGVERYSSVLANLALQLQPRAVAGAAIPWFGTPEILSRLRRLRSRPSHARLPRAMGVLGIASGLSLATAVGLVQGESQPSAESGLVLTDGLPKEDQEKANAVAKKALDFILAQQFEDGSFPMMIRPDKKSDGSITGYAALALVRHGGLDAKSPYRAPLEKAIDYILSCQVETGWIKAAPKDQGSIYHHSYATAVLAKARGALDAGRNGRIETALPRAVGLLLAAQKVDKGGSVLESFSRPGVVPAKGGWRYLPTSKDSDLSCTAAAVLALHAAREAKVEVPDEVFVEAADYAERLQNKDGGFGYNAPGNSNFTRAGMGLFILEAAGRGDAKPAEQAVGYLHRQLPEFKAGPHAFYGIYWGAAATTGLGNPADQKVYASWMVPVLLDLQGDDGSFGTKSNRIVPTIGSALAMGAN